MLYEVITDPTQDLEYSMAQLAVKGLPYFKITEITSESAGASGNEMGLIKI